MSQEEIDVREQNSGQVIDSACAADYHEQCACPKTCECKCHPYRARSAAASQQAYETFRRLLADHAPLPWQMSRGFIVDANGNAILGSMMTNPESIDRVLAAVICGVSTCGGYKVECIDGDEVKD